MTSCSACVLGLRSVSNDAASRIEFLILILVLFDFLWPFERNLGLSSTSKAASSCELEGTFLRCLGLLLPWLSGPVPSKEEPNKEVFNAPPTADGDVRESFRCRRCPASRRSPVPASCPSPFVIGFEKSKLLDLLRASRLSTRDSGLPTARADRGDPCGDPCDSQSDDPCDSQSDDAINIGFTA